MLVTVPVDPGADEARDWLLDELAKPEYQAAKPSWFDQLIEGFTRWLESLFQPTGTPADFVPPLVMLLVIAAVVGGAFLLFGRPRLQRTQRRGSGEIFGSEDARTATDLRESARRAHASGDDSTAVEEMFRALARRLDERGVIPSSPAMTAQEFATRSSRAFPDRSVPLALAARHFDTVRYLRRTGTTPQYAHIDTLTADLWNAKPSAPGGVPLNAEVRV